MVKIEVRKLPALQELPFIKITPSNLNPIMQCPLRALYANQSNKAYRTEFAPFTLIGNVIHSVLEELNKYLKGNKPFFDFDESWQRHELAQCGSGLQGKVKNYSVYRATIKSTVSKLLNSKTPTAGTLISNRFEIIPELLLSDAENRIEGRPDLLILKEGRPWEIKDYKTGGIYDSNAESDGNGSTDTRGFIKESYKKQLYLYAWLVEQKYGFFPEKLTIVTNDGSYHPVMFEKDEIRRLIEEIKQLFGLLGSENSDVQRLAKPSEENCRFCVYRVGCSFSAAPKPDPVGDISGKVKEVKIFPYGSCSFLLDSGVRIVFPKKNENISDLTSLYGEYITLTLSRRYFDNSDQVPKGLSNFYVPTKLSVLFVKGKA